MPFGGLLTVGLISGGTQLLGGILGGNAQKKAAKTQADAAKAAADAALRQYETTRGDLMPWMRGGQESFDTLLARLKSGEIGGPYGKEFRAPTAREAEDTPGYQFTLDQGNKAILRGQAASGGAFTGGTMRNLANFNKNLADTTYNDTFLRKLQEFNTNFGVWQGDQNRGFSNLYSMASLGENAAAQAGNFGAGATAQANGYNTDAAAATAAGTVGSMNSYMSGVNGLVNNITGAMTKGLGGSGVGPGMALPTNLSAYSPRTAAIRNPANMFNYSLNLPSVAPSLQYDDEGNAVGGW